MDEARFAKKGWWSRESDTEKEGVVVMALPIELGLPLEESVIGKAGSSGWLADVRWLCWKLTGPSQACERDTLCTFMVGLSF
jgi:hypothetical protein